MGNQTLYYQRAIEGDLITNINKIVNGTINYSLAINDSTLALNVDDVDKDDIDQALITMGFKPVTASQISLLTAITTVTSSAYTVQRTDRFIGVNSASDPVITLPTSELRNGRDIIIMDTGGLITPVNVLTIDTEGSEQINGDVSLTGITAYSAFRIRSDGINWFSY